jgi:hypothetical protein
VCVTRIRMAQRRTSADDCHNIFSGFAQFLQPRVAVPELQRHSPSSHVPNATRITDIGR